jgi:hypothetical protein
MRKACFSTSCISGRIFIRSIRGRTGSAGRLPERVGFCRNISCLSICQQVYLTSFYGGRMDSIDDIARLLVIAWLFLRLVSEIIKFLN